MPDEPLSAAGLVLELVRAHERGEDLPQSTCDAARALAVRLEELERVETLVHGGARSAAALLHVLGSNNETARQCTKLMVVGALDRLAALLPGFGPFVAMFVAAHELEMRRCRATVLGLEGHDLELADVAAVVSVLDRLLPDPRTSVEGQA